MVNAGYFLKALRVMAAITVAFFVFYFFVGFLGLLMRTGRLGIPIGGPKEYATLLELCAVFGFLFTPMGLLLWEYRLQPVNNRLWIGLSFCIVAKEGELEKL